MYKERSASLLIAMFYIEVYTQLNQKYDPTVVSEKLRKLGHNVAKSYYEIWKPSSTSISGLAREISEKVGGIKKLKLKRLEDGFTLSTPDCPLCLEQIEIEGPHYCITTMAILEMYLNLVLQDHPGKFRYKHVIGTVLQSKSSGAEECVYHYRLIEK
ncbi:MAG: hypothetical protein ACTSQI_08625 [Candidatus Helarchaeota archaeon]